MCCWSHVRGYCYGSELTTSFFSSQLLHHGNLTTWLSRDVYISSYWFCCLIQSLTRWYLMACCKSIIVSVSPVCSCVNLEILTSVMMQLLSVCIPSSVFSLNSDRISSLKCQKCSSTFIMVCIESGTLGFSAHCGDLSIIYKGMDGLTVFTLQHYL